MITINTDGISEEQKTTKKFQSAYKDMMDQLTVPGFIPVLCAHEAAHAIYFHLAGAKEFQPQPARIEYVPALDDYKGHLAAIQVLDLPPLTSIDFDGQLLRIVCAHAAGGVAARKLMPESDGGDGNDKQRFKGFCNNLNMNAGLQIDFNEWWNSAQAQVAGDLENPQNMTALHREALRFQPLLGL